MFMGSFTIWQNIKRALTNFLCYLAHFHCCRYWKISQQSGHTGQKQNGLGKVGLRRRFYQSYTSVTRFWDKKLTEVSIHGPKRSHASFLKSFYSSLESCHTFGIFVAEFVAKSFQKSPNLVTLATPDGKNL